MQELPSELVWYILKALDRLHHRTQSSRNAHWTEMRSMLLVSHSWRRAGEERLVRLVRLPLLGLAPSGPEPPLRPPLLKDQTPSSMAELVWLLHSMTAAGADPSHRDVASGYLTHLLPRYPLRRRMERRLERYNDCEAVAEQGQSTPRRPSTV